MPRQRRSAPGVDAKLLIKDAGKLLPEPSRRLFLRGAASLGALAMLSGCDIVDGDTSESALRVISTFNDRVQALLFNPQQLAPDISGKHDHPAVPVQCLLRRGRGAGSRRRAVQARDRRQGRQQETVDACRTLHAAAKFRRSHAMSASKAGAPSAPGRACACPTFSSGRRRLKRQICLVPVRRGLFEHHRYADRAASADAD